MTQVKEALHIIKIGGSVIDDQAQLDVFLQRFSEIPGLKILVHGGGKIATAIGNKLAIQSQYVNGRRITDTGTIDLVTMVYGGLINKKITAALQNFGTNAIGITGADGNLIPAKKRPVKVIDFGWVGDIDAVEIEDTLWKVFLQNKLVPVVAPLTHDGAGHILNTNADTMAAQIAICLSKIYNVRLIYCFEKDGILTDVNDPDSVVPILSKELYQNFKKKNKVAEGILPKIDNSFDAIAGGVKTVTIGNSQNLVSLISGSTGTKIMIT